MASPLFPLIGIALIGRLIWDLLDEQGRNKMYNCHEDMLAFHDAEVTLPETQRKEMRQRRNTNRDRLKAGLERDNEPQPFKFQSQGSYAMHTMVQDPSNDYDIDDGVYFTKEALKGPRGGDRAPADVKEMVRKALHDDKFKKPPEVRTNCVRVYYDAGYHVDVPVYRRVTHKNFFGEEETFDELASTEWKRSDPVGVTDWFNDENKRQSPNLDNGGQLRRDTRYQKNFSRSRESWRERMATGFTITKLVTECYVANDAREDRSLYDTMVAMRNRLNNSLEVNHPTVKGEKLTKGPDDARTKFLREKLNWAIDELKVLFEPDCTRAKALDAWDTVFNTDFFSNRLEDDNSAADAKAAATAAGGLTSILLSGEAPAMARTPERPVDKQGGGRYA
ncbi:MAG: cyclic GMP-AMP synthase DncV-like nucleotidyltransferase [Rhodospirillaceae bacterium]